MAFGVRAAGVVLALATGVSAQEVHLLGISGDGAATPEALFLIDPSDASASLLMTLGNGDDGEAIAFDPDVSLLLYHASGSASRVWESVDVVRRTLVTSGPPSGDVTENLCMVHDPETGGFLVGDGSANLLMVTPSGVATPIGVLPEEIKGLAFGGGRLYGAARSGDELYELDSVDGSIISTTNATLGGSPVDGMNGLAAHPRTGELWGIFRQSGDLMLGTIDPSSGTVLVVGVLPDDFQGLAFVPDPVLVGVTGDGATTPESLFVIDPSSAAATHAMTLGNGGDGETIGYNPDDDLLYHASGISTDDRFWESIDVFTRTIVASGQLTGPEVSDESTAMVYNPSTGRFLVAERGLHKLFDVTLGGAATQIGTVPEILKGLAFIGPTLYGAARGSDSLYELDPSNGSTIASTVVSLDGGAIAGMNGLATHPLTGELWGVFRRGSDRLLGTVDPATGVVASVGTLPENFAGITYLPEPSSARALGAGALAVALGAARRRWLAR